MCSNFVNVWEANEWEGIIGSRSQSLQSCIKNCCNSEAKIAINKEIAYFRIPNLSNFLYENNVNKYCQSQSLIHE